MTAFGIIILGFAFVGAIIVVLVITAFEDTKTFRMIDERIAERIKKDRKDGEEE